MPNQCSKCGSKLSLLNKMSGTDLCPKCKQEIESIKLQAQKDYPLLLQDIWLDKISVEDATPKLNELIDKAKFKDTQQKEIISNCFSRFADDVLADDKLTEQEENKLLTIASLMGITQENLKNEYRSILFRLSVARINDGRLPVLSNTKLILKKGEIARMEMGATILKEVAKYEYRGGYSGVSFRVAKGISYRTGGMRGQRVNVGTEIKQEDSGIMVCTSQRSVFLGSNKTVEIPYDKILSMDIFDDGIRFHLSNKKGALFFKLESGHTVAAIINASMQNSLVSNQ